MVGKFIGPKGRFLYQNSFFILRDMLLGKFLILTRGSGKKNIKLTRRGVRKLMGLTRESSEHAVQYKKIFIIAKLRYY